MTYFGRIMFFILAMCPAYACAQPLGTRIGTSIPRTNPERVFAFVVKCYVERNTPAAVRLLAALPGSVAEERRFFNASGAIEVCLNSRDIVFEGNQLEVAPSRYRSAIARLLVSSNSTLVPETLPAAADSKPWFATRIVDTKDFDASALSTEEFGDCVARNAWSSARAVALAKPKSADERRGIAGLTGVLGPCVPVGQTIRIDREALAPLVATAVYRIAVAPTLEARYSAGSER